MKRIILDASVVLKWYLADEVNGQKALDLLNKYIGNDLEILAPSLLEYEVTNELLVAQKRGRVKEESILSAIEGFLDLDIKLVSFSHLYPAVMRYCKAYGRSIYDASYLALAEIEGVPMITADQGLYNVIKRDLNWVKWLGDI